MESSEQDPTRALERGLGAYVRAVATAVGVPAEGTTIEISDTATAYLALSRPWPGRPRHDVMLLWSEKRGWTVAVETAPDEDPVVIARWAGDELVPPPREVTRFVDDAASGRHAEPKSPPPSGVTRQVLARQLGEYVPDRT
ncbi:DUF6292 family protein [Amycolatopsis sp., V23-08]|uniref:DUF6292 family protein n=1 Tax=Amycolatopsis heterodermiae TaxID=3110235 RepID=A0ABU5R309_9PSEU|nr:DUF6292 family protein [Amycolatopsis sp., V23-08]MEA5360593.1 DUF6292 family protein [Amycolatopsis sp., V23-08]